MADGCYAVLLLFLLLALNIFYTSFEKTIYKLYLQIVPQLAFKNMFAFWDLSNGLCGNSKKFSCFKLLKQEYSDLHQSSNFPLSGHVSIITAFKVVR